MNKIPSDGQIQQFTNTSDELLGRLEHFVVGKRATLKKVLACILSEGHLLIEDLPGVGKTTLAKALASVLGGTFHRVQCTPDLLPADLIGTSVYNPGDGTFSFRPGPVFANILLADELNRAAPKTQSALLEAMAEGHVTVDGKQHSLPAPFVVIGTQNPLDHAGTFQIPDNQLDRFQMRVSLGYPDEAAETELLATRNHKTIDIEKGAVLGANNLATMARFVRRIHVSPLVDDYLVRIAAQSRNHPSIRQGISPRALLGLRNVAQATAAIDGKGYVGPELIKTIALPVLAHRIVPSSGSTGTKSATNLLSNLLSTVPPPTGFSKNR